MKFLLMFLVSFSLFAVELSEWKEINHEDGIRCYSAKVKGKKIYALKGDIEINAPMEVISSFFYDTSKKKLWIAKLKDIKTIRRPAKYELVEHYTVKTPFFLDNRDFVYKGKITVNNDKTVLKVDLKSVIDSKAPEREGIVRGELIFANYTVEKIKDKKVKLTVTVLVDPKGSIPKWVVNLFQKSWPYKTLSRIREIAMNGGMPAHPDIVALLKK